MRGGVGEKIKKREARVLIVDDFETVISRVRGELESCGIAAENISAVQIKSHADVAKIFTEIEKQNPDLILIDQEMILFGENREFIEQIFGTKIIPAIARKSPNSAIVSHTGELAQFLIKLKSAGADAAIKKFQIRSLFADSNLLQSSS